jgi:hypothetical protein
MCFNPLLIAHAVINALDQSYEPRILHLMHQRPFPNPLEHDSTIQIIEHRVEGAWPAVWYFKLKEFVETAESPLFALMDEDDRWEHRYLEKALAPVIAGRAPLAWNFNNVIVKNRLDKRGRRIPLVRSGQYRSAIGTLVGTVDALWEMTEKLARHHPIGLTEKGGGPIDARLKNIIEKSDTALHSGMRYYFYHMNTNTKGDRAAAESVDYGFTKRTVRGGFKR